MAEAERSAVSLRSMPTLVAKEAATKMGHPAMATHRGGVRWGEALRTRLHWVGVNL
jgi:hypothetical protein